MSVPNVPQAHIELCERAITQLNAAEEAVAVQATESLAKFQTALADIVFAQRACEISPYIQQTLAALKILLQTLVARGALDRCQNVFVDCGSHHGVVVMEVVLALETLLPDCLRLHPQRKAADGKEWTVGVSILVPK